MVFAVYVNIIDIIYRNHYIQVFSHLIHQACFICTSQHRSYSIIVVTCCPIYSALQSSFIQHAYAQCFSSPCDELSFLDTVSKYNFTPRLYLLEVHLWTLYFRMKSHFTWTHLLINYMSPKKGTFKSNFTHNFYNITTTFPE